MLAHKRIYAVFALAMLCNVVLWCMIKDTRASWETVPPPPSSDDATNMALGDKQFAYRSVGFFLQNFGDSGGRVVHIDDYDFDRLVEWFFLADYLDPESSYVSKLAAYYYGAGSNPANLKKLLSFLEHVGTRNSGRKWLLLACAMKIARYDLNDLELAYHFAERLATLDNPNLPEWTRRAPAIVLQAKGDREAAYEIMLNIMKSEAENINTDDVIYLKRYICEDLLTTNEAADNPLCDDVMGSN